MDESTPLLTNDEVVESPRGSTIFRVVNYVYSVILPGIFISMIVMGSIYYLPCHKVGAAEIPTLLIVLGCLGLIEEIWRHIPLYRALYYLYLVGCIVTLLICSDIDLDVGTNSAIGTKYCTTGLFVFNTVMIIILNIMIILIVVFSCIKLCKGCM